MKQTAKEYFDENYDHDHISSVVKMIDMKSLYNLMEEYATQSREVEQVSEEDIRDRAMEFNGLSNLTVLRGMLLGMLIGMLIGMLGMLLGRC